MDYKEYNNLSLRRRFSYKVLSKNMDLIPIVIQSEDYDISKYIGSLNKRWICKEYYKKTELKYILLDILKNVFINNIILNEDQQIEFIIGTYKFPLTTCLDEIYKIYRDKEDDILYLMLVKSNTTFIEKWINIIRGLEYKFYKLKDKLFVKNESTESSPYVEIV